MEVGDNMVTDDYIPQLDEVKEEFERLRERFPFLEFVENRQKTHWRLHGMSSLNLDVNIDFFFVEISDTLFAVSGQPSLNAYLRNHDSVIHPSSGSTLTPCWELRVGTALVKRIDRDPSAVGMIRALTTLMSIQARDGEENHDPITSRATRIARLDPTPFD
jgi:hypothetical protein